MTPTKRPTRPARHPDTPGVYRCPRCETGISYQNPIPDGVNCCRCWIRKGLLIPCLWSPLGEIDVSSVT
jgi:hypothetical protein